MSDERVIVENRAGLDDQNAVAWRSILESHRSMRSALDWMLSQHPPLIPAEMIAQDEFSFDLPVPVHGGAGESLWIVYSTS